MTGLDSSASLGMTIWKFSESVWPFRGPHEGDAVMAVCWYAAGLRQAGLSRANSGPALLGIRDQVRKDEGGWPSDRGVLRAKTRGEAGHV